MPIVQVRTPYEKWDDALKAQFNYIRTCVDSTFLAPASHEADNEYVEDESATFTNVGYSADIFPKFHQEQKRDLFTIHLQLLRNVKPGSEHYVRSFEAFHVKLVSWHKGIHFAMPDNRILNPHAKHVNEQGLYVWQSRHWLGIYDKDQHKRVIYIQGLFHKE